MLFRQPKNLITSVWHGLACVDWGFLTGRISSGKPCTGMVSLLCASASVWSASSCQQMRVSTPGTCKASLPCECACAWWQKTTGQTWKTRIKFEIVICDAGVCATVLPTVSTCSRIVYLEIWLVLHVTQISRCKNTRFPYVWRTCVHKPGTWMAFHQSVCADVPWDWHPG